MSIRRPVKQEVLDATERKYAPYLPYYSELALINNWPPGWCASSIPWSEPVKSAKLLSPSWLHRE